MAFLTTIAMILLPYTFLLYFLTPAFPVHENGVILITGASTGIGREAAFALAEQGYEVFAGVRKTQDGEKLKVLRPNLKNLHPIIVDVVKSDQIQRAQKEIESFCTQNDLPFVALVNNAGVAFGGPLEFYDIENLKWVYDVNVFGLMETTKEFIPLLRKDQGRIVNIGSVAGLVAMPFTSVYAGTKFAVEGLSEALRRELKPFGVSVSVVEPAYVSTPIGDKGPSLEEEYGEEATKLYRLDKADATREKHFAMADTTAVTDAVIIDAIINPRPQISYVVANAAGVPAKVIAFMKWLFPWQIFDLIANPK